MTPIADPTPAYAALTWTSISGISVSSAAVLAMGVAVLKTGRSPLTLLQRGALRIQGEWMWLLTCAWPAVLSVRWQYEICATKVHRRVIETVRPAARGPVAEETFNPPPGSAHQELLEIRETMRNLVEGASA